jgi:Protein of unknown function (DUF1360)
MEAALNILLLSAAVATCSMTTSKSKVAAPLHAWTERHAPQMITDLLQCPYCLNHWFALFFVLALRPTSFMGGLVLGLAIVAFATIIVGFMMHQLMMHESEKHGLKQALRAANAKREG